VGINTLLMRRKAIDTISVSRKRDKTVLLKALSSELRKALYTFGITR
jgi:hypothetical protein